MRQSKLKVQVRARVDYESFLVVVTVAESEGRHCGQLGCEVPKLRRNQIPIINLVAVERGGNLCDFMRSECIAYSRDQ